MRGNPRIGVVQAVGAYALSLAMPAMRRGWPEMRVHLCEDLRDRLLSQLGDRVHDVLLLPEPPPRLGFAFAPLLRESLMVAVPHDHRLARQARVAPEDLRGARPS
ncbi:LysR substrate-binding domain-containing protein [Pseudogemmobacter sonorensis]|uniref:LysR substrate-binding domain-containing protein n=1 Tax=Pseudogemmobacter sonorensis TaxID=2989681 RepID=UPI0036BA04B5